MQLTSISIAAVFAIFAIPALAAEGPSYSACDASAAQKGIQDTSASYKPFMVDCLADPPPGVVATSSPQQISRNWDQCEALAMQRGVLVNERRGSEAGRSPWKQFMDSCLAGQVH
jgi:hypothetical protein